MELMIFSVVFATVFSLVLLALEIIKFLDRRKKKKILKRNFGITAKSRQKKDLHAFKSPRRYVNGNARNRKITPIQSLEYLLIAAEIPLSPKKFMLIFFAVGVICSFVALLLLKNIIAAAALFLVCQVLPLLYLYFKKKQIQEALVMQMPDALGMIVRAIKVGQSVDASLKNVAASMPPPLGTEMRIVYEEIKMGLPFEQALQNFENRYPDLADVKIFCTSFIIQRETGGNLSLILEGLADTIKKRFHFARQVRTYSAEARMSSIVIGLLPLLFVLVTSIFNPQYITRLTDNPMGRILVYSAFILEFLGFILMRRMAQIKV
jgi:tight adherence protein B